VRKVARAFHGAWFVATPVRGQARRSG
jgi:hypothetical protein